MRKVVLFAVVAMSGCVEPEPPAPSPAMMKLRAACESGDTYACAQIAQMEQQARIAMASLPPPVYVPPQQQFPMMTGGTGQSCTYTAYGGVVQQVCY